MRLMGKSQDSSGSSGANVGPTEMTDFDPKIISAFVSEIDFLQGNESPLQKGTSLKVRTPGTT